MRLSPILSPRKIRPKKSNTALVHNKTHKTGQPNVILYNGCDVMDITRATIILRNNPGYLLDYMDRRITFDKNQLAPICQILWDHFYLCRDLYYTENEKPEYEWNFELEMYVFEEFATEFLICGRSAPGDTVDISIRNIEACFLPSVIEMSRDSFEDSTDLDDRRMLRTVKYLEQAILVFPEYNDADKRFQPFLDICYAREKDGYHPTLIEMVTENFDLIKQMQVAYQQATGIDLDVD